MNKPNLELLIHELELHRDGKSDLLDGFQFNMAEYGDIECGCIASVILTMIRKPHVTSLGLQFIMEYLDIPWNQAWKIFGGNLTIDILDSITLDHAILQLKHLYDTGIFNWNLEKEDCLS